MPREKEQKAYTFSQTLRSQIRGLNIIAVRCGRTCRVGIKTSSNYPGGLLLVLAVEVWGCRNDGGSMHAFDRASGARLKNCAACKYVQIFHAGYRALLVSLPAAPCD